MTLLDLTLNRFVVPNMPTFQNEFGVKKTEAKQGLTTAENVINTMLPFLRQRPIEITQSSGTSTVEANAAVTLAGNVAALTLGEGAYKGVELLILNDANGDVILNDKIRTLTTRIGETITLRWNGQEWRVKHDKFVGDLIQQLPSEKDPIEKWLEGRWVNWSHRAVMYNISDTPPAAFVDYYTLRGTTIAANATPLVMYHVTGSDFQLFRFRANSAAYTVPDELDPVKWDEVKSNTTVFREACQKLSYRDENNNIILTNDLQISNQITEGIHTGKYIIAVYVLGGKFLSITGGFRPPFGGGIGSHIVDQPNVPDYANMQTVNRLSGNGSWTNNQGNGFVCVKVTLNSSRTERIRINGITVFHGGIANGSGTDNGGTMCIFPVKNGDIITVLNAPTDSSNPIGVWFIPPLATGIQINDISQNIWLRYA